MKLLVAPYAVHTITVMAEAGFAERVLGGVPQLASFAGMVEIEAAMALAPSAVRRLGALGVVIAEDAERLRERLRLSNAEYAAPGGDGRSLVADFAVQGRSIRGRRIGAHASLPAGAGPLPRSRAARLVARGGRRPSGAEVRPWRALATLPERWEAAALSAARRRPDVARARQGPRARRGARRCRGGLDRGGISVRSRSRSREIADRVAGLP